MCCRKYAEKEDTRYEKGRSGCQQKDQYKHGNIDGHWFNIAWTEQQQFNLKIIIYHVHK